jgi:glutamyl-tRNA synthetase
MGVTLITRSEEWLTSVPLHLQLFKAFELPAPQYCHLAPICKLDEGKKRKLSKRKDPEANVEYFFESGYPAQALLEYIMTLADSAYEDWQRENEDKSFMDFQFSLEKMNVAGPLFDFVKLQNISNIYLSKISTEELYNQGLERAEKYKPELANLMKKDPEYTKSALNIERHTEKDPKRFTLFTDIEKNILFFFDEKWPEIKANKPEFPENIPAETWKAFAEDYANNYDISGDVLTWFEQLKEIGKKYGFAANNAEFKQ